VRAVCAKYDDEVTSLRQEIDRLRFELDTNFENSADALIADEKKPLIDSADTKVALQVEGCSVENQQLGHLDSITIERRTLAWAALYLPSRVQVKIASARHLRDADIALGQGTSDPYCICRIVGRPETELQTQCVQNCLNPVWNFEGEIVDFGDNDILEFVVMDKDWLKYDDFLGKVTLPPSMLVDKRFAGRLELQRAGISGSSIFVEVNVVKDDTQQLQLILNKSLERWPLSKNQSEQEVNDDLVTSITCKKKLYELKVLHSLKAGSLLRDGHCLQHLVMEPSAHKRMCWDTISMFVVAYDVLMVPLITCFDLSMTHGLFATSFFVAIFWSLDVVSHFFTGFYEGGLVEMRLSRISKSYLQSWFIFDMFVVMIDWCFLVVYILSSLKPVNDGASNLRVIRSIRILRSLKIVSVMRVAKSAPQGYTVFFNLVQSPLIQTCLKVFQVLVLVLTVNHVIACFWYRLGITYEFGPTWVEAKSLKDSDNFLYVYLTSSLGSHSVHSSKLGCSGAKRI